MHQAGHFPTVAGMLCELSAIKTDFHTLPQYLSTWLLPVGFYGVVGLLVILFGNDHALNLSDMKDGPRSEWAYPRVPTQKINSQGI